MKRIVYCILFLFMLSCIAGLLLSKISFVGKAGIWLMYRDYSFFKSWWQSGLMFFCLFLLIFFIHHTAQRKLALHKAGVVYVASLIFAVLGLYITYNDFNTTLSHRLLGKYFHAGMYLFWLGWMSISILFIAELKNKYFAKTNISYNNQENKNLQ